MSVYVLTHASASAPALTGAAGSLIGVLDFCLVTTLGWTKSGSGNVVAYRQPSGTNQFYLRVDDSSTTAARVRMYETLTDVAAPTGTNPMPTDAMISGGGYWNKGSAGSTQRPWGFYSDGKIFYLVLNVGGTAPNWDTSTNPTTYVYYFGDALSYKSGDAYGTYLLADSSANASSNATSVVTAATSTNSGHFVMRPHTQIGSGVLANKYFDYVASISSTTFGVGSVAYPGPVTGGLEMSRVFAGEAAGRLARLQGMWAPLHPTTMSVNPGDTFSGASGSELNGRTFVFHRITGSAQVVFETSDTWSS